MAEESTAGRFLCNLKRSKAKTFPHTSSNHWAYEAVSKLSDTYDCVCEEYDTEGLLTRYDFARIIFDALQQGTPVDRRLVLEFVIELQGIALTDLN